MNHFYIFLAALFLLYLAFVLLRVRKQPVKRDFANAYFFTLVTFFIAIHPSQLFTLSFLLTILTLYHVYILVKR